MNCTVDVNTHPEYKDLLPKKEYLKYCPECGIESFNGIDCGACGYPDHESFKNQRGR
jgi:hypothetical protein